jgi:hypothetical protein
MKEEKKTLGDYYHHAKTYGIDAVAEIEKIMHQSIFDNAVIDWHNEKYNGLIAKDCSGSIYNNEPTVSLETKTEVSPYMILI